jgi:hypothetical protein
MMRPGLISEPKYACFSFKAFHKLEIGGGEQNCCRLGYRSKDSLGSGLLPARMDDRLFHANRRWAIKGI